MQQPVFSQTAEIQQPEEKFVSPVGSSVVVELQKEVKIVGTEIRFRQLFRYSKNDAGSLANVGDLVVARFGESGKSLTLSLKEIQQTLTDAGVNLAVIRFAGSTECRITRSDADESDDGKGLEKWINEKQKQIQEQKQNRKVDLPADPPATRPAIPEIGLAAAEPGNSSLRSILLNDLAERLHLAPSQIQLTFDAKDDRVLSLREPTFRFRTVCRRGSDLGLVAWDVTISTDSGQQKLSIMGQAQAWQEQVVPVKSLAFKQVIRPEDVTTRRSLVDRLGDDATLKVDQVVGQQAARDLRVGVPITARLVDATPLVRTGELITVVLTQGTVQLRAVAKAMENGAYGQSIRVKNEATREIYDVVVTGPRQAALGAPEVARVR